MLHLLKKRYEHLCRAKFSEASEVEHKLTKMKNENFDWLVTPNTYYCTFMEGVAKQKAI